MHAGPLPQAIIIEHAPSVATASNMNLLAAELVRQRGSLMSQKIYKPFTKAGPLQALQGHMP